MPRFPAKYPAAGESAIGDAIRARRGARGLTPLDGALLNAPEIASGWNSLLGAVRTKNTLPGDVRELLVLRVAARNTAAYEWIHHEHVGRDEGLTTEQLSVIRDTTRAGPSPSKPAPLTALQAAALAFADASTRNVHVPQPVFDSLRNELSAGKSSVDQQLAEASLVIATYNMVSRFLVATDVGDCLSLEMPYPSSETTSHKISVPGCELNVRLHKTSDSLPYLVFVNSLMTNLSLWDDTVARLSPDYNIITFDQRGHGKSSIPKEACTMDQLADDIAAILESLKIPTPVHSVIGVSQGGASTLAFAVRHGKLTKSIVACDTQIKTPQANIAAWDERIAIARKNGMKPLSEATVPRWFPAGSIFVEGSKDHIAREMIESTPVEGFVAGARALQGYDYSGSIADALKGKKALLLAGQMDGKLPEGLKALSDEVNKTEGVKSEFYAVPGAGHLPMLEGVGAFLNRLQEFLSS